jgi:hypothetical protein
MMPRAWVLVVGMHRSGTSAATGVLHGLGLSLPSDLMLDREDNEAHNESVSLTDANDNFLGLLGGSWDAPPDLAPGWEHGNDFRGLMPVAARVAASAFPRPGVAVWKDPRNCLLLPYWAQVIAPIAGIVLSWRAPLAVARSLATRDGIPVEQGLDLWCRYNEAALAHSQEYDVLVLNYDEMVEKPQLLASITAVWLEKILPGISLDETTVATARQTVAPRLRHERAEDEDVPTRCRDLEKRLAHLQRGHQVLASKAGPR